MKKKMKSLGLIIGIGLLALVLFGFKGDGVKAADVGLPHHYEFNYNGVNYKHNSIIPVTSTNAWIQVEGKNSDGSAWSEKPDKITWQILEGGNVIGVKYDGTDKENQAQIIPNRPGRAILRVEVEAENKAGFTITTELLATLDVKLAIKKEVLTGIGPEKKDMVVVLDYDKEDFRKFDSKQLRLEIFPDKVKGDDDKEKELPQSIDSLKWVSLKDDIASVDSENDRGKIEGVGAGTTVVRVETIPSASGGKAEEDTVPVIVLPKFKLADQKKVDVDGKEVDIYSSKTRILSKDAGYFAGDRTLINDIAFDIDSNAINATNLQWEIVDDNGKHSSMKITPNPYGYDVKVTNAKMGDYTIFAYSNDKYKGEIDHTAMNIRIPFKLKSNDILMNVGDVYDILENSTLINLNNFDVKIDDTGIVDFKNGKNEIIAKKRGDTKINIRPKDGAPPIYDANGEPFKGITINVKVIDGISLNISRTTMFVGSKLRLEANVTDPFQEIEWTSSDNSLATVDENGIVTALRVGDGVKITATVKIDGVTKQATAIIDIIPSITKIEITPENVNLKLQEEATLIAKLTPANIKGVELVWKSSNEKVVDFVKTEATSARIVGKSSGTAVITAVNKDNVVMGYAYVTVAQPVTGIKLSDTNLTLRPSAKHQLYATIMPENATNKNIIWRTSDDTIASVDENGLVTVKTTGRVVITAVSAEDEKIKATCEINSIIPVTGINIKNKTIYMNVGGTDKIDYEILPANANDKKVTFTSTNPSVATVDANGNLKGINQGMAVILVRTDSGHLEYATVFVTQQATDIIIDAKDVFLKSGQTYDVKVTYIPAGSASTRILWESTNLNVVTVDQNGKLTAKDPGTAIVIARTETGRTAFINVHVVKGLTGITITPLEKELFIGEEFQYNLTFIPADATHQGVKWTSSNTSVASIDEATGKVKALKAGSTIITAISTEGNHKVIAMLTVKELATTIELNHTSYRLGLNTTFTLEATIASSVSNQKIRWTSSNPSVATVNQNGKVTGKKLGKATITAIAQDGSLVSASCNVEVVRKATKITMNKPFVSLSTGKSETLKTIITPKNTTYKGVKWSSSDESIVAVDANGRITGIQIGRAVITATIKDDPSMKAVANVEVVKYEPPKKPEHKPITSITVPNQKITMLKGEKVSVKAAVRPVDTSEGYSWSSNSNSIATVNKKTGMITAKSTGVATITVMADSGAAANIEVTVIGLDRTSMQLVQYSTDFIMIEGYRGSVNWYSENPSIATVSGGKIISRSPGTTNIVAVVNGKKLVCRVTVRKG